MEGRNVLLSFELEKAHKFETHIQNALKERSCDISTTNYFCNNNKI